MIMMKSLSCQIWVLVAAFIFFCSPLSASKIAVLTPEITYTTRSLSWLSLFLQEQIELALQQQDLAVMPSEVLRYWEARVTNPQQLFQLTQTSSILKIEFQTVLNQISISASLIQKSQKVTDLAEHEFEWRRPRDFLGQTFKTLKFSRFDATQARIAQLGNWKELEEFYRWKQKAPVGNWNQEILQLEAMATTPAAALELASVQLLQYWQTRDPQMLEALQTQIAKGLSSHQYASHYHALASQLNYILGRMSESKTDAIVARSKNKQNLIANAMYGVNVGIKHHEGRRFIRSAIEQFPPLIQPEYFQQHKLPQYEILSNLIKEAWADVFNLREYLQITYQARQAIKRQQWYEASQLFYQALQLIPNEIESLIGVAQTLIGAGQYSDALSYLERLEQQFLDHPTILIYKALVFERLNEVVKAKRLYQQILGTDPKNFQALLRLSALLTITQNYQEAETFLKTLTVFYPQSLKAWKELGLVYWRQGNKAEAKKTWQQGLLLKPDDPTLKDYLQRLQSETSNQ